jgi:hypothetical protein
MFISGCGYVGSSKYTEDKIQTADRTYNITDNIAYGYNHIDQTSFSEAKADTEYSIIFKNSSNFSILKNLKIENFYWIDDLSFNIIQLQDIENSSVAKKLNQNIKTAMTSWIAGKVVAATEIDLSIFCHSDNYLSFKNSFKYDKGRVDYIYDYITFDVKTGERVMLDDLIEINSEFAEYILFDYFDNNINAEENDCAMEFVKHFEADELLKYLEECSLTQEEIIRNGYFPIDKSIGSLVFRNSFYIKRNTVVIVLQGNINLSICLDDIEDFLKVEKW